MNAVNYKCPCCSAPISFSAQEQQLTCSGCGNKYTPAQLQSYEHIMDSKQQDEMNWGGYDATQMTEEGLTGYHCSSCGGEVAGDGNTAATCCPYCGNSTILPTRLQGMYRPDYVVPFRLSKEDAQGALRNFCKGKRLLPKFFLQNSHIEKIQGVYVPFWLFDCNADGDMNFQATKVTTWMDKRYHYTRTDHYAIARSGNADYNRLPVDGSSRMADNLMDAIEPYDYSAMVPFTAAYLSGFLADKYDIDANQCAPRANQRIKVATEKALRETVKGYNTVVLKNSAVRIKQSQIKYALLPVWVLTTRWMDKPYVFILNGQTGQVAGELPVDKKRYWAYLLGWFGGISLLGVLLFLLYLL